MATEVSQVTQTTSNIPEWAKPYAERLLGESERLSRRGYQAYQGQMTEGFNPLQNRAFLDIGGMRTAPQLSQATGLAGLAGLSATGAGQYDPVAQQQFYSSPLQQPGGLNQYMSPYMQGVVEQQKGQAIQDYARQIPGLQVIFRINSETFRQPAFKAPSSRLRLRRHKMLPCVPSTGWPVQTSENSLASSVPVLACRVLASN
jgi:hypothetical protein